MRVGVVLATVVLHAGVIGGLLVFARDPDPEPSPEQRDIDFDVVQPKPTPVPRPVTQAEPGPAPVRRVDPPRSRPPRRSARPPVPVSTTTATAPAPTTNEDWVVADPVGPATGDPAGGGTGSGGGDGGDGNGSGGGARDLSGPPVPLNATVSKTLPYTEQAARARVTGDVQLVIHVDAQGAVAHLDVRRGLGYGLDEIATKIAQGFTFKPATDRAGHPTTGSVRWRFHFEPP